MNIFQISRGISPRNLHFIYNFFNLCKLRDILLIMDVGRISEFQSFSSLILSHFDHWVPYLFNPSRIFLTFYDKIKRTLNLKFDNISQHHNFLKLRRPGQNPILQPSLPWSRPCLRHNRLRDCRTSCTTYANQSA